MENLEGARLGVSRLQSRQRFGASSARIRSTEYALVCLACCFALLGIATNGAASDRPSASPAPLSDQDLIVSTTQGRVRGQRTPRGGADFLGIPFAKPPTGALRWQSPYPASNWKGIRDAGKYGAPCAQAVSGDWNRHHEQVSAEDCLYLNVIIPRWPATGLRPVMVWIHGGGNTAGTASSEYFTEGTLVEHGVMLVTINYRLGIFGFLAHPELTRESRHHASGNYALMDQVAALRWVKENIAAFGGDPQNVTIFGQSAGALNASVLMTSPLARNLFHRVIAQSGTVLFNVDGTPLADAEGQGMELVRRLGAPPADSAIAYLRARSAGELLAAIEQLRRDNVPVPEFNPIIDGWVVRESPTNAFAAGRQAPVPLLLGSTAREVDFPAPPEELREGLRQDYDTLAQTALQLYGLADGKAGIDDPLNGSPSNQITVDKFFRCPASTVAGWQVPLNESVYQYQFERSAPGRIAEGAVHSAELRYVFGNLKTNENPAAAPVELDRSLADTIGAYWANFARSGDPNSVGLPHWPRFTPTQSYLRVTEDADVAAAYGGLRRAQCDLYRKALTNHLSSKSVRQGTSSSAGADPGAGSDPLQLCR